MQLYKRGRFYHFDFWLNGERHRGSTKLEKKADAQRYVEQYRTDAVLGKTAERITVGKAAHIWFERHASHLKSARTIAFRLRVLWRHLDPDTLVSDLTADHVAEAIQTRRVDETHNGRIPTNATINRDIIDNLRPILSYADEVLAQPVNRIKWTRLRLEEAEPRSREFTPAELSAWRQGLPEWHRPLFDFMARYGVRLSEAYFTPDDVKPEAGVVTLRDRKNNKALALPLLDEDMRDLAARATRAKVSGLDTVWFREKDGRLVPSHWRAFQSASRKALQTASVADARPAHDLRHHAATALLRATGNTLLVQHALGHDDVKSTARYAHVSTEDVRAGFERAYPHNAPGKKAKKRAISNGNG